MEKLGSELEFISQIKRDGSGTEEVHQTSIQSMQEEVFKLTCLSMTEKTFIATSFNSYVVKLKPIERKLMLDVRLTRPGMMLEGKFNLSEAQWKAINEILYEK